MFLGGTMAEGNGAIRGVNVEKTFYRIFRMNMPTITQEEVDCILLNFTNEAIEVGILPR